jgi:hypothetical protein
VEFRLSVLVQHDELAVYGAVWKLSKVCGDLREEAKKVVTPTREQIEPLTVLDQQRSITVVL